MDVLIIGGGLTGLTTALVLAERGHRVEIFEAKASTCRAASYSVVALSGARTPLSAIEPLPAVERIRRRAFANDGALRWSARAALRHAGFVREALRCSTAESAEQNARDLNAASLLADQLLSDLVGRHGLKMQPSIGLLTLSDDALPEKGPDESDLDDRLAKAALPALAETPFYRHARFNPDARAFSASLLARQVKERLTLFPGVKIHTNDPVAALDVNSCGAVVGLRLDSGRSFSGDAVVVAAGVESARFLSEDALGSSCTAPLSRPMITAALRPEAGQTRVGLICKGLFCAPSGETLRAVGPWMLGRENEVKLEDAYRALWNIAVAALPQAADWTKCRYHVQSVLGNPDGLGSVGPTLKPGLWCNAGGGMHGADFCALYAELLADLLDGQSPSRTPVDAWAGRLSPLRYSGT